MDFASLSSWMKNAEDQSEFSDLLEKFEQTYDTMDRIGTEEKEKVE